jgi:hypothetical protein
LAVRGRLVKSGFWLDFVGRGVFLPCVDDVTESPDFFNHVVDYFHPAVMVALTI